MVRGSPQLFQTTLNTDNTVHSTSTLFQKRARIRLGSVGFGFSVETVMRY